MFVRLMNSTLETMPNLNAKIPHPKSVQRLFIHFSPAGRGTLTSKCVKAKKVNKIDVNIQFKLKASWKSMIEMQPVENRWCKSPVRCTFNLDVCESTFYHIDKRVQSESCVCSRRARKREKEKKQTFFTSSPHLPAPIQRHFHCKRVTCDMRHGTFDD